MRLESRGREEATGRLSKRRAKAKLTRLAAAVCAGLAMFAALSCVEATVATTPVVVATREIARGNVVRKADVEVAALPASSAMEHALGDMDEAVGTVAQGDIEAGQPLFDTSVSEAPVAPDNRTVLEVRVASDVADLIAGDRVALATAITESCPADAPENPPPEATDGDASAAQTETLDGLCSLSEDALVMAKPRKDDQNISGGTVSLALPPQDALRVMAVQENAPIVAIATR